MRFLETFVLFCLLTESPPLREQEIAESNQNSLGIACCGRGKDYKLLSGGREISIVQWGNEIFEQLAAIAGILDEEADDAAYSESIEHLRPCLIDTDETPSAQVLKTMRRNHESFAEFARRLSTEHAIHWRNRPLTPDRTQEFRIEAEASWRKQEQIEASEDLSFDEFLQQYWQQA
jgi:glutamate--cysteine ligase